MKPEQKSQRLLGITRSKAKMLEYSIPEEHHIKITQDPVKLFTISIGLLGDLAAAINRGETDSASLSELRDNLLFSARFFDSYLQSKLNDTLDPYLELLGSASYYLCDLPGSASVLAKHLDGDDCPDLDGDGLEDLLLWLLQGNLGPHSDREGEPYDEFINGISECILQFFKDGTGEEDIIDLAVKLREAVYRLGTPRQLLFGDVIGAILRKKLENSVWKALPTYSGLSRDKWLDVLQKESFTKELWPAQHLLGKAGVLKGRSAIVQMPTSAGKTKATEMILRSGFLADRISLAIIIAPFRALCHEIKNSLFEVFRNERIVVEELSDALQIDFEIDEILRHQQILIITPEKLLYVLRHAPELATHIGLLVYDEGHQFDNSTRGITYELLLTSLHSMITGEVQKVLMSAVISNANAVGEWLNGEPNVVEGTTLIPTFRSVGFASWLDQLGRIEYVDSRDAEQNEFFVPRVIEQFKLGKRGRETVDRFFPEKSDGSAIALYLGLKLVSKGSIAIFCSTKVIAASICKKVVDIIERKVPFNLPLQFSDRQEVERLTRLHVENLGIDAPASHSATHGIFSHHGNTPHGVRLAVEYAMREGLVRFVVCTSTLAQGVNLPIRYLIVSSVYQGKALIKVRDFHNLIGRAGRAGMHTEGSILFADSAIYDKGKAGNNKWRWKQVKNLLNPDNSEPCISNLLSIFEPIESDDGKYFWPFESLYFAKAYIRDPDKTRIAKQFLTEGFSRGSVEGQVIWRISLISAVESFLLSHWDETGDGLSEDDVIRLAEGTLAFFLANDQQKEHIRELFQILAKNISANITDPTRRKIYGRTLYGVQDARAIEEWVQENAANLLSVIDETEILDLVWPLFTQHIDRGLFNKFDKPEVLKEIANGWISGKPYSDLLAIIDGRDAKTIAGTQLRKITIDQVVDLCEGALAYDGALLVGAVYEFIEAEEHDEDEKEKFLSSLQFFQKRIKYGLPTQCAVTLYELGFADRVIAQKIEAELGITASGPGDIMMQLKTAHDQLVGITKLYPAFFQKIVDRLLPHGF